MEDYIERSKTITKSESSNKIKAKAFYLYQETGVGGGQASYNLPGDFFNYLIEKKVLVLNDVFSHQLTTERQQLDAYVLNDSYKLIISKKIMKLIDLSGDDKPYGLLIVNSDEIKPQMRHTNYESISKIDISKNYTWFPKLYKTNYQDTLMLYSCDTLKQTLTIDIDTSKSYREAILESSKSKFEVDELHSYYETTSIKPPLQLIYFGAPGTGKSYKINETICNHDNLDKEFFKDIDNRSNIFRTTIYADYTNSDFIGSILPKVVEKEIRYDFVPGIFSQSLKYAFDNPTTNTYLVLEEMSRGNVVSIFGEIFHLLDRDSEGNSEYKINNELIAKHINFPSNKKIFLPKNFSILGTINTSDQNVFSMDTAFKRRFEFEYVPTNPKNDIDGEPLNNFSFRMNGKIVKWVDFYVELNRFIVNEASLNEDKQIGQFFIKVEKNNYEQFEENGNLIRNKLLNYLWHDVNEFIFSGTKLFSSNYVTFNQVYEAFYSDEELIFSESIEI